MRQKSHPDDLGRGVYKLPFVRPDGSRPCVAVTSNGVCVATYNLPPGGDEGIVSGALRMLLSEHEMPRNLEDCDLEVV